MDLSLFKRPVEEQKESFSISNLLDFLGWKYWRKLSGNELREATKMIFQYVVPGISTDISGYERTILDNYLSNITFNTLQLMKLLGDLEYSDEDIDKIIYRFIYISIDWESYEELRDLKVSLDKNNQYYWEETSAEVKEETWTELHLKFWNDDGAVAYKRNRDYSLKKIRLTHRYFLRSVVTKKINLSEINIDFLNQKQERSKDKTNKRNILLAIWAITATVSMAVATVLSNWKEIEQVEIESQDLPVLQVKANITDRTVDIQRPEIFLPELSEIKRELNQVNEQLELSREREEALIEHLKELKRKLEVLEKQKWITNQVEGVLNWTQQNVVLDKKEVKAQKDIKSTKESLWNESEITSCSFVTSCLVERGFKINEVLSTNTYKDMFNYVNPKRMSKEQVNKYVEQISKEINGEINVSFDEKSLLSQATLRDLDLNIWDKCVYESTKHKWMPVVIDSILWDNIVLKSVEYWNVFAVQHELFKARYLWAM